MRGRASQDFSVATSLEALHRPSEPGVFRFYAGDLEVTVGGTKHHIKGDIELRLVPRTRLSASFAGSQPWLDDVVFSGEEVQVAIPVGADLGANKDSAVEQAGEGRSWISHEPNINHLTAGAFQECKRFVLYTSGDITRYSFRGSDHEGESQGVLCFGLPGWNVRIAAIGGAPTDGSAFTAVIEAVPIGRLTGPEDVSRMARCLFLVLSLVCSRETVVGPVIGLGEDGSIRWVELGAPRDRDRSTLPWRWCARSKVSEAIPALASGLSGVADTPMEPVIDRAINHLFVAEGSEVLDVRIPIACSGLELLSWSVLQYEQWVIPDTVDRLTAAARLRLLLQWAGVPVALPAQLDALAAKRGRLGQPTFDGPEVVVKIRNELVHPPKRFAVLEWPTQDELFQCWQLATWYLELTLLRLLRFEGEYKSRLQLGGWEGDVEPLPWMTPR
jgi:hypothetical protein